MMYRVIDGFVDLEDGRHRYEVSDMFPREGLTVTPERIALLLSRDNKAGRPLIKAVEEPKPEPVVARRRKPRKD